MYDGFDFRVAVKHEMKAVRAWRLLENPNHCAPAGYVLVKETNSGVPYKVEELQRRDKHSAVDRQSARFQGSMKG